MIEILEQVFTVGPQIIAAATGATMFFKSTNSNPWINMLLKVLNCLAGNVKENKNADDNT
ncbi:MAG: hypothetical protein JKX72_02560 [Robiginitomaculum sp.]|nr:hypothetical protein [Robiginitomaculum sp.]